MTQTTAEMDLKPDQPLAPYTKTQIANLIAWTARLEKDPAELNRGFLIDVRQVCNMLMRDELCPRAVHHKAPYPWNTSAQPTPSPADLDPEKLAKQIAFWHGQKLVLRRDEQTLTVAALSGFGSFGGDSASKYADTKWREYTSVADFLLEEIAKRTVQPSPATPDALGEIETNSPAVLKGMIRFWMKRHEVDTAALAARVEELERALKPFAKAFEGGNLHETLSEDFARAYRLLKKAATKDVGEAGL